MGRKSLLGIWRRRRAAAIAVACSLLFVPSIAAAEPGASPATAERIAELRAAGDPVQALELALQALEGNRPALDLVVAELLLELGRTEDSARHLEAASQLALDGGDEARAADLLERAALTLRLAERDEEALALFQRLLRLREESEGPQGVGVANAARHIASGYERMGRTAEAELMRRRALAISEAALGTDHVLTGFDLMLLGLLYSGQQRFGEAEPLLLRAVVIMEAQPETREQALLARTALSSLLAAQGRRQEAADLAAASLEDMAAIHGPRSPRLAEHMIILARTRLSQGRTAEAERLAHDARSIMVEHASGSRTHVHAISLLGDIRSRQGSHEEALALHREALSLLESRFGRQATQLQAVLADVGHASLMAGMHDEAIAVLERSVALTQQSALRNLEFSSLGGTGEVEDLAIARAGIFDMLIHAYRARADADPEDAAQAAAAAFLTAQRVIDSRAATAIAQMSERHAAGDGALAVLIRERQDLTARWRRDDRMLGEALAPAPADRDAAEIDRLRGLLARTDARLAEIDARIAADFPEFARFRSPETPDLDAVRQSLDDGEVLLFFADADRPGEEEAATYLWAVPRSGEPRWLHLERGAADLAFAVRHLRDRLGVGGELRGARALAPVGDAEAEVLAVASALHRVLLAPVADMIEGRELVIVPSRSLAGLPFHMLVGDGAGSDGFARARWLVHDHAVTTLPSVAALTTSRAGSVPSRTTDGTGYVGFANPLISGPDGRDRRAYERGGCTGAAIAGPSSAVPDPDTSPGSGHFADMAALAALAPLPETVDEACAVALALGAGPEAVVAGAAATEAEIRRRSDEGSLSRARVLHFATHALVTGEIDGLSEPAILMTPPQIASPVDDGLLSASEVTTLRLDADWVILSACNTAAGDGGGEALSGLARSFFYAGARSLMVSHWPVNSDAAVRLTTDTIDALATEPAIGRAEALRRAMVMEIARGGHHADPANWAPFVLVGADR